MTVDQVQNAILFSASSSLKTGNMALDMILISTISPLLIYVIKLLFDQLGTVSKYIMDLFKSKPKEEVSPYAYTLVINSETRGKDDKLLNIHYYNDYVIKGLADALLREGCMNASPKALARIDVSSDYTVSHKKRLLEANFIIHPEVPVEYDGMEFTFLYKNEFSEASKENAILQTQNSVTIKYNDREKLMDLLARCKNAQVNHEYPEASSNSGEEPLFIYKMSGTKSTVNTTTIEYYKIRYESQRDFSSLHFDQKAQLESTLDDYFNFTGPWDKRLQRPHKCVIVIHGTPGTGKTSCIKAIAKKYKLNIQIANMPELKDNKELQHFFFDQTLQYRSRQEGRVEFDYVPSSKRLILLEDLDAENCQWLKQRSNITQKEKEQKKNILSTPKSELSEAETEDAFSESLTSPSPSIESSSVASSSSPNSSTADITYSRHQQWQPSAPTLSGMLNSLDGILELNSVVIITTNDLSYFDKAMMRPGRIDFALHLSYTSKKSMIQYFQWYYQIESLNQETINALDELFIDSPKITPAELQEMCQNASTKPNPTPLTAISEYHNVIKCRTQVYA